MPATLVLAPFGFSDLPMVLVQFVMGPACGTVWSKWYPGSLATLWTTHGLKFYPPNFDDFDDQRA